jgi:hypothetical protein
VKFQRSFPSKGLFIDPAYRDVSLTDDLAAYLFSYKILHCVHMRKRAGPLAEISFEFAEIIGRRDENFSI